MTAAVLVLAAAMTAWDYPAKQERHDALRAQFVEAVRKGDAKAMEAATRQGTALLPDDPTWRFNRACALAWYPRRSKEAFDQLEKAIDLGFRDADAIKNDSDLKRISGERRFAELVEYAKEMSTRAPIFGPLATTDATGVFGKSIAIGSQNVRWDLDAACFVARVKLAVASAGGNSGDLYMNRDGGHAPLDVASFPGITPVTLDAEGRKRGMDLNEPNMMFPYPVFGNCSRAFIHPVMWRSIPRAVMTSGNRKMQTMARLYASNQIWVFPSNEDTAPVGTNGDVFASISPMWLTTAGRSYSDLPYLRAALKASAALPAATKKEAVRRGLLSPTIQTLIRKSLRSVSSVSNETDYLTWKAHPTAMPPGGVDVNRLVAAAAAMKPENIPPLAPVTVAVAAPKHRPDGPEITYATPFAVALVLRSDDERRTFLIAAAGASEFAFAQTHGEGIDVKISREKPNVAKVTIDRRGMSPTNRVDIAVFGRNKGTGWGAPSYVSFARMDPEAPYSDPVLTNIAAQEKAAGGK